MPGSGGPTATRAMAIQRPFLIRDAVEGDLEAILLINQKSIPAMNSVTREDLRWFTRQAEYFRVAVVASKVAGFLICLAPEAPYGSPNFRWLKERYEDFLYIDRVAVRTGFHRQGIASGLYRDAAGRARTRFHMFACEVNTRPRNQESIRFHRRLGFRPVGSQDHGYVEVQYMVCPLPFGFADRAWPAIGAVG